MDTPDLTPEGHAKVELFHPATKRQLSHFDFEHLPDTQKKISVKFWRLAWALVMEEGLDGSDVTVGLRKLLETKDCFVRASLP